MNQLRCPPKDALRQWSSGALSREAAHTISVHLDNCPSCRAHVEHFEQHENQPPSTNSGTPLPRVRDYELLAKLGEGGMGTVYKARHVKLRRLVAVKVLSERRLGDPEALARFQREMEAVGRLDHPHVVRAMDAGEHNGMHYLVMEYVSGIDLAQLVDRLGPLPIADGCELARQAALGLQAAHDQQMVHRDIKPSNLILAWPEGGGPPIVKILDLGLARLSGRLETPGELTMEGHMVGTLDYMAPEQSGDSRDVDIRADLYSLGATLYRLLSGHVPFGGEGLKTPLAKLKAIANDPPLSIRRHRPTVPPALEQFINRLMAKSPGQRPATPRKVAESLAAFTAHADLQKLIAKVRPGQIDTKAIAAEAVATRPTPTPRTGPRPPTPLPAPAPAVAPAPTMAPIEPAKSRTTPPPFRPTSPTGADMGSGPIVVAPTSPRPKAAGSATWITLTAAAAFLVVLLVGGGAIALFRSLRDTPSGTLTTEQVVAQSEASVALIRGRFAQGTGFLAQPNILVTNKHLIALELPGKLEVHFPSAPAGERGPFTAELLYEDDAKDLAILRVAPAHKPLPIAAAHHFRRGQEVIAIGNPSLDDQVLDNSVIKGVMSTETTIGSVSYYQLSMSVGPGNSGWPVMDDRGQVIGLVTLLASRYDGLACCIPLDQLRAVLDRLPSLADSDIQRADSLHRARAVLQCVEGMAQQYHAGMQVYSQQIQQAAANSQSFDEGVAAGRSMLTDPVSQLDEVMYGDLTAEVPRLGSDQHLEDAARTSLQELWTNYLELKGYVDQPRGDAASYAAKSVELADNHNRLSQALRGLLNVDQQP